jgi:UDPglucose--hexose-1-phosphate uridylyltransferase
MTGGGFGGCVIALIPTAKRDNILEKVAKRYKKTVGYAANFYPVNTHDGTARSNILLYIRIRDLVDYAIGNKMCKIEDRDYVINRLLAELNLNDYEELTDKSEPVTDLTEILEPLLDHAFERGCFAPNTVKERDLFEARLMNILMPRPSELNEHFKTLYKESPQKATQYFYTLSQDSNYIKNARIAKNITWRSETDYGVFDMTINLSKPEKDPRDIIASGQKKSSTYPKCLLCKENVGYEGHAMHPARANHRIVPVELNKEQFYLQYSPYMYYSEHCIVLKNDHVPMSINQKTFVRLLDFVDMFPHYYVGSNADLPIVGGSILSHEHYQGGAHRFAVEDAKVVDEYMHASIKIKKLYWPLSVLCLESSSKKDLENAASCLLKTWREYSDDSVGILARSGSTLHHTISPLARYEEGRYKMYMALRNNRTSEEHPLGIFHPHAEQHHIKKENIGIIEAMGLAILPARLETELSAIAESLVNGKSLPRELDQHKIWFETLKKRYPGSDVDAFIHNEVSLKFVKCLEDAGVYKQDEKGQAAFDTFIDRFINALKGELS